jgi:protein involved in polysaccharide export with SLBB domain
MLEKRSAMYHKVNVYNMINNRDQFSWTLAKLGLTLGIVLTGALSPVLASESVSVRPSSKLPPVKEVLGTSYRLAAEDVISVIVMRHPEMSVPEVLITSSGVIQVPGVGLVSVAGKTLRQVEQQITAKLKNVLLAPQVTVSLKQARPRLVFVVGPVAKPGVLEIKPGWRVSEAVAMAGGLSARPDLVDATLTRAQGKPVTLDLKTILSNNNHPSNYVLRAGDTLRLTERSITMTVVGQVARPGSYTLPTGSSVIEVMGLAGGATSRAALTRATIQRRDGRTAPVDLYKIVVQGQGEGAPKLQQGDVLTIPESNSRVTVLGAVARPGTIEIPDGRDLKVSEALAQVGGPSSRAALTQARVRQINGNETVVDLYQLLVLGNRDRDFNLSPNDVLTLPESKGVTVVGAVTRPGTYYIEAGSVPRMADVLALAGGLTIAPEVARISIARPTVTNDQAISQKIAPDNGSTIPVPSENVPQTKTSQTNTTRTIDPVSLLELRDPGQNEPVMDGDLISVTAAKSPTVYLSGEVLRPGAYELKEGDGIPELLTRAGGPTPAAILSRVSVTGRDGVTQVVNVRPALQDGGQKLSVSLQEGDFVVVPQNKARVYVMQAVNKPGYYPIPEDQPLTVGDALSLAGGPKDRARVKEIAVLRQGPNGIDRRIISLTEFDKGNFAINQTLRDGDVLYVPEGKTSSSAWETITRAVGSLGVLGALF